MKVTVTGPVYQPLAFLVPAVTAPVMVGCGLVQLDGHRVGADVARGVLRRAGDDLAGRLGRRSVAGRGDGGDAGALVVVLGVEVTVTSALFQSSALASGDEGVVTVGAMLSHFSRRCWPLGVAGVVDRVVGHGAGAAAGQRHADGRGGARGDLLGAAVDAVPDFLDTGEPGLVGRGEHHVGRGAGAVAVAGGALVVAGCVLGAVPSMLMPPTVLPALALPATSVAGSLVDALVRRRPP